MSRPHDSRWFRIFVLLVMVGALAVAGGAVTTADGTKDAGATTASLTAAAAVTNPGGPLTRVEISPVLNCAVSYLGDTAPEFFGDTACGTLLAAGGTLYGPATIPAGGSASPRTAYTPVSQTQGGTGTSADPYVVDTTADAGSPLHVHQIDKYVAGEETYRTDTTVTNSGNTAIDVVLYKAADCYLQNNDRGAGAFDPATGAVSCLASLNPGARIEQFYPISSGSRYVESGYSDVWALVGSQQPFPNECRQCANIIDNGMGLSWTATIPAGGSITRSHLTNFSPIGNVPLQTTKTARDAQTNAGGTNAYTITVSNPNTSAVTLSAVTDQLPAGFTYNAGSTTGVTTTDPTVTGSTLTWAGPFPVAAQGNVTLTFGVTVSATEPSGTYTNQASADAQGIYTVAPTGPTAPVTVGGTPGPTLTVTVVGPGSVTSTSGGISCPGTCSATFPPATSVGLTPAPATGATFAGWSGACTGTGACNVTMDADKSVTATFTGPPPPTGEAEIEGEGHYGVRFPVKFEIDDVQRTSTGVLEGDFEFTSRSRHLEFESTAILSLDRLHNVASFTASGELNDRSGYTVTVTGVDMRHKPTPSRISIELKDSSGTVVFSSNGLRHVHDGDITIEDHAD